MHCQAGTNNREPRWTLKDPWKPEVRPGAREESASHGWLAAPAMNARTEKKKRQKSYFINMYLRCLKRFPCTRVIQKVLLCTKYYVISNAYPYLVYSNLFRKVSWRKAQFNQSRDLLSKCSRVVYLDACLRHWQVSLPQPFSYHIIKLIKQCFLW